MSAPSDASTSSVTARVVVPDIIHELVERFERNRSQYRAPAYNETQVRREFLDPFFEALGWDVNNRQGYAEAYKDVVHEDAIRIAGKHKAPDYSFRVGGTRKFFVEAKKPSVDLARDPQPALQVRRYAWSAKLPLSILTDFEELVVYDCRIPPEAGDPASTARTMLLPFSEYPSRWDEIYSRFSRDAVLKGSFDLYTDTAARKRGTAEVDTVFLKDLQTWREVLARNIALRNPGISARELNFAVQQILDRLVFLRICEDRQIEDYGRLKRAVAGKGAYTELTQLFRSAEDRYNSGLFHFKTEKGRTSQVDAVTPSLTIDDKVFKEIVKHLYYPDSPYEFSVVSADILGQVYEQFLGQVIRLTPAGRAEVEDKPAVRKAGGVFYTPVFIVAYIVLRTVGRLLEGKTPKQVSLLRFLDPACGSGSFLIAVYQFLLDWHLAYYMADGPETHARGRPPRVYQSKGGTWRLTGDEKKRILLNNIYGVDIDSQAVEVTKLSLVLKVLEGETEESLGSQLALFQDRVLPDLGNNIKCGNSLISPRDLYAGQQPRLLEEEELYRVNPFDWKAEFPHVFAGPDPGFDVVLGNPPYIRIQMMTEWAPLEVEFYKRRYATASKGNYDIYVVFVERGLELLNSRGQLGYILPHKFFNAQYGEPLRKLISDGWHLSEVVHFGHQQVFEQASTYTALLFLSKSPSTSVSISNVGDLNTWRLEQKDQGESISNAVMDGRPWTFAVGGSGRFIERLREQPLVLGDVTDRIFQGLKTGADSVYIVSHIAQQDGIVQVSSKATGQSHQLEAELLRPLIKGGDSHAYEMRTTSRRIIFPYTAIDGKNSLIDSTKLRHLYPLTWSYLEQCRHLLEGRERGRWRGPSWYGYSRQQALDVIVLPKLFTPDLCLRASVSRDATGSQYFTGGVAGGYGIIPSEGISTMMLLALLNSRVIDSYVRMTSTSLRGGYFSWESRFIRTLPIPKIDSASSGQLAEWAAEVEKLKIRRGRSRTQTDSTMLDRQITAILDNIDRFVSKLYGLGDEDYSY